MAILWYGFIPLVGAVIKRYKWYVFRKRFNELSRCPMLNYHYYRQQGKTDESRDAPAVFHFTGGIESITDDQTLWIRSDDLTIPVSLINAQTYLLPMQKDDGPAEIFDPGAEAPEKIRWERVCALAEGARVFAGGLVACQDGRWGFVSTKEIPLIVIFYDGPGESLATMVIRAGRQRTDYWNALTPYSLIMGALCLILMAVQFIPRPAFRLTVIASCIALFIPLYPIIPPGLLFTVIHRRMVWKSRALRIKSSLTRIQSISRRHTTLAYILETLAWMTLLAGIGLNIFFLSMILALL